MSSKLSALPSATSVAGDDLVYLVQGGTSKQSSVSLLNTLSNYSNAVIVDAGGNGDYPTIGAAMAAITDAASNKRYKVFLFGTISEPAVVTAKDYVDIIGLNGHTVTFQNAAHYLRGADATYNSIRFTNAGFRPTTGKVSVVDKSVLQSVNLDQAGTLDIRNCDVFSALSASTTGTIILNNSIWTRTGSLGSVGAVVTVRVYNSRLSGSTDGWAFTEPGCNIRIENSRITANSASSVALNLDGQDNTSVIELVRSTIESLGATGFGLNVASPLTGFIAEDCTFRGATNQSAQSGSSWTNAPFYQCRFRGGTTNITANAGTANGTNVTF